MRRQLPLIIFFVLLPKAVVVEGVVADTLNLGFLIPLTGTNGRGQRTAAGIPIGLEAAQGLLPNITLNWTYVDSSCDETSAPDSVIQLQRRFSNNIHVVFGTLCNDACGVVGFVADAINAPFLSSGCFADRLGDRSAYKAFARSVPPASAFTPVIRAIFKQFGWQNIPIVVTTDGHVFQELANLISTDFHLNSPTCCHHTSRVSLVGKISHLFPNDSHYIDAKKSFVEEAAALVEAHGRRLNCNKLLQICCLEIAIK